MDRLVRIIALLVIIGLIGLSVWLPSFIPMSIRAIIGWVLLSAIGIGAVILFVLYTLAQAMRA